MQPNTAPVNRVFYQLSDGKKLSLSTELDKNYLDNIFSKTPPSLGGAGTFIPILPVKKSSNVLPFGCTQKNVDLYLTKNPYFKTNRDVELRRVKVLNDLMIIQHIISNLANSNNLKICHKEARDSIINYANKMLGEFENNLKLVKGEKVKCSHLAIDIANKLSALIAQTMAQISRDVQLNPTPIKEALIKLNVILYEMVNRKICKGEEIDIAGFRQYMVKLYDNICSGMLNHHVNNISNSIMGIMSDVYGYE